MHRIARLTAVLMALVLVGTATPTATGQLALPVDDFEPPVAIDLDPDPDTVEVTLVAQPSVTSFTLGPPTLVWAYNGVVPGPTIEAEVGNRVIVHFCNMLPPDAGETTIHWHGVELASGMDGTTLSQDAVAVGECFDYDFTINRAATYWYHSHVQSAEQVEHGLHGTLVVRDPAEDAALGLPTEDRIVVLDDVLLDDNGQIPPPPDGPLERSAELLNGREGNVLLVNGRADRILPVTAGKTERWRIVNTSNARVMRLAFPGLDVQRIGGEAGLAPAPETITDIERILDPTHGTGHLISDPNPDLGLMLLPGERADIVFTPQGDVGQTFAVVWHDFPRGQHATYYKQDGSIGLVHDHMNDGHRNAEVLLQLAITGSAAETAEVPDVLRPQPRIDVTGAAPLTSVFGHGMPMDDGSVMFFSQMADGAPLPMMQVTPEDAHDVTIGETRVWEIRNMTGSDHPFHSHGFFLQPIEVEYVDNSTDPPTTWIEPIGSTELQDTIRLPQGPMCAGVPMTQCMGLSHTIVRAAVVFDDTAHGGQAEAFGGAPTPERSGGWLFHCHILEHGNNGMMSYLETFEPA